MYVYIIFSLLGIPFPSYSASALWAVDTFLTIYLLIQVCIIHLMYILNDTVHFSANF
jgi:hypothetical protein